MLPDTVVDLAASRTTAAPRTTPVRRPPPDLTDKLRRALWRAVHGTLWRLVPTPLHSVRRAILRAFGAAVGPRVAVYPGARIYAPWRLVLRRGATVGDGARLYSVDRIEIGEQAIVSQGAHLCTAAHDIQSPMFDLVTAPVVVGAHAWIAADAFVGPGVTVGEGAVVAARAVAVRSVAPRVVVAGNPARMVGRRDPAARNRLAGRG